MGIVLFEVFIPKISPLCDQLNMLERYGGREGAEASYMDLWFMILLEAQGREEHVLINIWKEYRMLKKFQLLKRKSCHL